MKITKGYTLSQFVDKMYFLIGINTEIVGFYLICQYNDFLKQPLKKEMFVNELEKPEISKGFSQSLEKGYELMEQWKKAENKVIFKGWGADNTGDPYLVLNNSTTYNVEFSQDGTIFYISEPYGCIKSHEVKTIGDLFQTANGELKLQNVEL